MADESKGTLNVKSITKIGSYHVGKTIGKGNFAVVKLAEHCTAKYKVAIKMIDKSQLDEDNLNKVKREVRIMKSINHSNMIRLYEVMETERYLYLVMEYAAKGEIFDLLIKHGRLDEKEARIMFRQIISAVEYLHQKRIVHRDLKAENLLLDENSHMKLIDFGFSNNFELGAKLKTWCGSPPYAAPELFEGKEYYGPATDIWSMGVVLYVLVCGALPFDGRTLPDLKQRVLAGKFRIPYFMSTDCENLLQRMLVVDPNKRYTMNQIKLHKWIIQGEPYAFLIEEDEFCYAQQHSYGENGTSVTNEHVLEQMEKLGVDRANVIDCLQRRTFGQTYGLYHILLDKQLKAERNSSIENKDITELETLTITSKPESPPPEIDQKTVYFDASVPQADENNEPCQEELAKYFANTKRRETIAVSHLTPDYRSSGLFPDGFNNIPEISIFRSPTPPLLELSNQLQYKEQYLPRPAVLQVRPQFDRRASDGSATLQDTIARFNFQKSLSKSNNPYREASGQEESNNNVLGIPEGENGGSESDNEPDPEAVQKYLMSRGARQRHTFTCILEATPEEQDGSFKAFQSSKPRNNVKLSNRDRERGSPVPYLPLSPVPYLPVSPESRRSISSDRRPSDSGLSVHLYQDKRKDDQDLSIKQLQVEHKRLQDQFSTNPVDHSGRSIRRGSQNVSIFRHSYPIYQEGTPSVEAPSLLPSMDSEAANDHNLLLLHQKQEAQRKNLYNQLIVKRKFLEKQMEAERRELIRRASEGATKLESGVEDFLKSRKENIAVDFLKGENGNLNANADDTGIPPAATELQDEMKKLNLKVSSGLSGVPISPDLQLNESLFEERQRSNTNPNSRDISFNPSLPPWTGSMDVDDEALSELQSSFRYANVQSLFNNPVTPSRNRPRRGNVLPLSPRFGISHSGLPFTPYMNNPLEINNPVPPNGGLLWGGTDNSENSEIVSTPIDDENHHEPLNRTLSMDITSSKNIGEVVAAVKSCLDARPDVDYSQSDSYFSLYKEGIQMEIEVYPLEKLGCKNGVKLRRVGGDKWAYKKLRDDLLSGLFW